MKSKKHTIGLTLSLVLPLLLMFTTKANAYDLKTWNGSLCQAYYGSQEASFNKAYNGITNISNQSRWVMCALTDDTYGTTGSPYNAGTQGADIRLFHPSNRTTTCKLSERGFSGQQIDTDSKSMSFNGFFTQFIDTAASDQYYGSRVLACKLAPGARLIWIRVWEYDSSDNNH